MFSVLWKACSPKCHLLCMQSAHRKKNYENTFSITGQLLIGLRRSNLRQVGLCEKRFFLHFFKVFQVH